jgi:hypothetical protein
MISVYAYSNLNVWNISPIFKELGVNVVSLKLSDSLYLLIVNNK